MPLTPTELDEQDEIVRQSAKVGLSFVDLVYECKENRLHINISDYTNGNTVTAVYLVEVDPKDLNDLADMIKKISFAAEQD